MKSLRFIIFLLVCLSLGACHSSRKTAGLSDKAHKWHTLEVPVKVSVDEPMNLGFSGKALLVRDSSIYVSMRMLGMEVAYIYADADSAVLCDRFHKLYLSEPLDRLLPARYASIDRLQEIMLGQVSPMEISDKLQYSEPVETPVGRLYKLIELKTALGKRKIDADLIYNYDKARWDDPDFRLPPVKLPRNAERVDPQALMKVIHP